MIDAVFTQSLKGIWQGVMLEDDRGAQQALSMLRTKYSCSGVTDLEELLPRK